MHTTAPPDRRLRHAVLAILVVAILLWASVRLSELPTLVNMAVDIRGTLVASVFDEGGPPPLDPAGFPEENRRRLEIYLARRQAFRSQLPEPPRGTSAHETWAERFEVERAIVSLVDAPGIEEQAAAYASRAVLMKPWNRLSDGPLAEARDVESYLDGNPDTPLRPYLWLFLMHRYKAALPLLRSEGADEVDIGGVTMQYARRRALAVGFSDPLIGLIATDIDIVASVYPLVRVSGR
jgi:hypothetical protein